MKKKRLLGILALIGLSVFVVLGSSLELVGKILKSVQDNPITKMFTSEIQIKSSEEKTENNNIGIQESPTPLTVVDKTSEEVPERVLWRVIFSFPGKLEILAEEARQKGENDSLWSNFFTRQAKLSETDAQMFIEIANQHEQEIQKLNEQMQNLIEETRQLRKQILQKEVSQRNELIKLQKEKKKEVVEIQKQKEEVTLRYRDNFKNAVSEESYAAFEKWLKEEFAKGFSAKRVASDDKLTEPFKKDSNNGFKPINKTKKEENQK